MPLQKLQNQLVQVQMTILRAFEGAKKHFPSNHHRYSLWQSQQCPTAKNIYLEEHPDTKIHVIDSLSAGGEVDLLVEKLNDLIDQGLSFEEVVEAITAYQEKPSYFCPSQSR